MNEKIIQVEIEEIKEGSAIWNEIRALILKILGIALVIAIAAGCFVLAVLTSAHLAAHVLEPKLEALALKYAAPACDTSSSSFIVPVMPPLTVKVPK